MGLPSKSSAAFQFTAANLFQRGFKVYLWTFTFAEVVADWEGSKRFSKLINHLQKNFNDCTWGGVRVVELHKEHGVHYHALINRRLPIDIVRRLALSYGFGRIHVCRAGRHSVGYLAKYLSKRQGRTFTQKGNHGRKWASFGKGFQKVRVRDIEFECPMWEFRKQRNLGWRGFKMERVLRLVWERNQGSFFAAWMRCGTDFEGDVFRIAQCQLRASDGKLVEEMPPLTPF